MAKSLLLITGRTLLLRHSFHDYEQFPLRYRHDIDQISQTARINPRRSMALLKGILPAD
jgi:hypothetical protein